MGAGCLAKSHNDFLNCIPMGVRMKFSLTPKPGLCYSLRISNNRWELERHHAIFEPTTTTSNRISSLALVVFCSEWECAFAEIDVWIHPSYKDKNQSRRHTNPVVYGFFLSQGSKMQIEFGVYSGGQIDANLRSA